MTLIGACCPGPGAAARRIGAASPRGLDTFARVLSNRMASDTYHEPYELLPPQTRDRHRAVISLIEELEAIDWYQQRADVCDDGELRAVLIHNKNEEIEHAMMTLEWIRRNVPEFDERIRTYVFSEGPLTGVEEASRSNGDAPGPAAAPRAPSAPGSLGIGSLKGQG